MDLVAHDGENINKVGVYDLPNGPLTYNDQDGFSGELKTVGPVDSDHFDRAFNRIKTAKLTHDDLTLEMKGYTKQTGYTPMISYNKAKDGEIINLTFLEGVRREATILWKKRDNGERTVQLVKCYKDSSKIKDPILAKSTTSSLIGNFLVNLPPVRL